VSYSPQRSRIRDARNADGLSRLAVTLIAASAAQQLAVLLTAFLQWPTESAPNYFSASVLSKSGNPNAYSLLAKTPPTIIWINLAQMGVAWYGSLSMCVFMPFNDPVF
jgi:hypothetical protein